MGVQGLTSYVEGKRQFFQDVKFRDSVLIIDGCSLYFRIYFNYCLDQQHGGDYDAFSTMLSQFFSALAACNIQPYVVLDGGMDPSDKKFSTLRHRLQSKIKEADCLSHGRHGSVLPILAREAFVQFLAQRGVPLVQCSAEADWEIACLALKWNCPVLTSDSDFYIFDLPGGYLPFKFFNWTNLNGKGTPLYISAQLYTTDLLCHWFRGMNRQLLPLCAVLSGNDYGTPKGTETLFALLDLTGSDGRGRGSGKVASSRIEGLLSWLSFFPGPGEALDEISRLLGESGRRGGGRGKREEMCTVYSELWAATQEYHIQTRSSLASWFSGGMATPGGPISLPAHLPECLSVAAAKGFLAPLVLDVLVMHRVLLYPQVENSKLASSHDSARAIRQAIYGLLLQRGALGQETHGKGVGAQVVERPGGTGQVLDPMGQVNSSRSGGAGRAPRGRGGAQVRAGAGQDQSLQVQQSLSKDGVGSGQGYGGGTAQVESSGSPLYVEEYDRQHLNLKRNQVEARLPRNALCLDALVQAPLTVRRVLLLDVLGIKESVFASIPPNLWLAVGVTGFWLREASPSPSPAQLQALLLGMVSGEVSRNNQPPGATYSQHPVPQLNWAAERSMWARLDRLRVRPGERRGLDMGGAHSYSQWQACLWSATCLNHILLLPLPEQQISWLFSGSLVHGLLKSLSGGRTAEFLLAGGPLSWQLYCSLLDALRNCNSKTLPSSSAPSSASARRKKGNRRGRRGQGRGGGERETDLSNRFAFLMNEEEFHGE